MLDAIALKIGLGRRIVAGWLIGFALVALLSSLLHGPLPHFSTRTLGIAFEMWQQEQFWLPIRNAEWYTHKPPLLFWLIHLGWWVTGVGVVWPKVLMVLLATAYVGLCYGLGVRLALPKPRALVAASLLSASPYVFWFSGEILYELLLAVWVLLGWHAALSLRASDVRSRSCGFGLLLLATGAGLLTKGPVLFVHLLPACLAVPYCLPRATERKSYFLLLFLALLLGCGLALIWVDGAALRAGPALIEAYWFNASGRLVHAFDHARSWYWYAPWLLLLVWPLLCAWQAVGQWRPERSATSRLLLLSWLPSLLIFCLISGKQGYYLIPLLPAMFLWAALQFAPRALAGRPWLFAFSVALPAVVLLAVAWQWLPLRTHFLLAQQSLPVPVLVGLLGLALVSLLRPRAWPMTRLVLASWLTCLLLKTSFAFSLYPTYYDLNALAQEVRRLQVAGKTIASEEFYEGQLHFLGRLEAPILPRSARNNADFILTTRRRATSCGQAPVFRQRFRARVVELWPRAAAACWQ
jgi:4-amino-4-deoxy-L-arabinose transferase-like glycosyltransferase